MKKLLLSLSLVAAIAGVPVFAQDSSLSSTFVKKLKTSEDFTVKVAEAMPASDYSFKLTKEQMSFGQQLVHLAGSMSYFLGAIDGEKAAKPKVDPNNKDAVVAFIKSQYEKAIDVVSKMTPDQFSKTYDGEEGKETGIEQLMGMLDHDTHHRASAEMYLRVKGIKPPDYEN